jgi:hypothetical protein
MDLKGTLGRKPPFEFRITPLSRVADDQRALFRRWIREDWKPEIKYAEYTKSPDRKSSLDFV